MKSVEQTTNNQNKYGVKNDEFLIPFFGSQLADQELSEI